MIVLFAIFSMFMRKGKKKMMKSKLFMHGERDNLDDNDEKDAVDG